MEEVSTNESKPKYSRADRLAKIDSEVKEILPDDVELTDEELEEIQSAEYLPEFWDQRPDLKPKFMKRNEALQQVAGRNIDRRLSQSMMLSINNSNLQPATKSFLLYLIQNI